MCLIQASLYGGSSLVKILPVAFDLVLNLGSYLT